MRTLHNAFQVVSALVLIFFTSVALARPYVPDNESVVLERLPLRATDPLGREIAQMRAALQKNPNDLDLALKLARRYYDLVAEEGDPRPLGYAQAALGPWWALPDPPAEVRFMRAAIRQFGHDFSGALQDLDAVLAANARHVRARSLRATLQIVQARYPQARDDCSQLAQANADLLSTACLAMVDGLTGKARSGYANLSAAMDQSSAIEPPVRQWALIRLAEIAQRLGDRQRAERHFKEAVAVGIEDTFLLAAYADLLLDAGRAREALDLLGSRNRSDGLLLRMALAQRVLKLPQAPATQETLAARYAAARLRGDTVHQQEEARFLLATGGSATEALALASDNWKIQREPRDARVLLEAALAAKQPQAAAPVLAWMQESGIEDPLLRQLADAVARLRK